jgi:hypothetical protein
MIEITGEEVKVNASNDQIIMIPKINFDDNSNRGEMLFFLVYRHHAGMGNRTIWKPIYKSEIKANNQK